ncbi:hypothetical protein I4U23_002201 [Adineta vaga]|nr:hypothetical protein I4U23_002201 [Adineta vaga]
MSRLVYINRLHSKTTEVDLERFCTRFGNVIECVIYPVDHTLTRRSGYVKFASCQSAEKMYHQSREGTFSIDQTPVDIELGRGNTRLSEENHKKQISTVFNKKSSHSPTIYTLHIEGQIGDEEELINYLNSKPLSFKFLEKTDTDGCIIKTGAQVTYTDKELIDRILKQHHDKFTIELLATKTSNKREYESEPLLNPKRSKLSQNLHSSINYHLQNLTKLTHDLYQENEHLQNDKNVLQTTVNDQTTRIKRMENEAIDLIESSNKTHYIAKCIADKYKSREEEYQKNLEESNKVVLELETIIKTTNGNLVKAQDEIQRLTNQITLLESQSKELVTKPSPSELEYEIEQFFLNVKQYLK